MAMTIHQESVLIAMRLWSLRVGELAVELARESHEEIARPLTAAQIRRALDAHRDEHAVCMQWLLDVWDPIEQESQAVSDGPPPASS